MSYEVVPYSSIQEGPMPQDIIEALETRDVYNVSDNAPRAEYLRMLYDCRGSVCNVPDLETKPTILTNTSISENLSLSDLSNGSTNGKGWVMILPNQGNHQTISGVFVDNWAVKVKDQANQDVTINMSEPLSLLPKRMIPPSRDLSKSYTLTRPVASWTGLQSATTSVTAAAITGMLHAVAFNDLNDFSTFQPGEMADLGITDKDHATQVPVQDGIIYTPGPEILQDFSNPPGDPIPNNPNAIPALSQTAVYSYKESANHIVYRQDLLPAIQSIATNPPGNVIADLNIPRTWIGCKVKARFRCGFPTGTGLDAGTLRPTVTLYGVSYNDNVGYFGKPWMLNVRAINNTTDLDEIIIDLGNPHDQSCYRLLHKAVINLPGGIVPTAFTGAGAYAYLELENLGQGNYQSTGPGALIVVDQFVDGQTLSISQTTVYEAIPAGALAKDVKASSYLSRARNPKQVNYAELAFNSTQVPIRRIYAGEAFAETRSTEWDLFDATELQRRSSIFGSILKGINTGIKVLTPVVGAAFGPQYAAIGQAVGGVTEALTRVVNAPKGEYQVEPRTAAGFRVASGFRNGSGYRASAGYRLAGGFRAARSGKRKTSEYSYCSTEPDQSDEDVYPSYLDQMPKSPMPNMETESDDDLGKFKF